MILRPYQQEAVNAVYDYLRNKEGNPCVVAPTGCGKSAILGTVLKLDRQVSIAKNTGICYIACYIAFFIFSFTDERCDALNRLKTISKRISGHANYCLDDSTNVTNGTLPVSSPSPSDTMGSPSSVMSPTSVGIPSPKAKKNSSITSSMFPKTVSENRERDDRHFQKKS